MSRKRKRPKQEAQTYPLLADFLHQKKKRFFGFFLGEEGVINDIISTLNHKAELGAKLHCRVRASSWKILKWAQRNHINYKKFADPDIYDFWIREKPEDYGIQSFDSFEAPRDPARVKFRRCCICTCKEANLLLSPCGHIISCENCYTPSQNEQPLCPLCRTRILSVHEVDPSGYLT